MVSDARYKGPGADPLSLGTMRRLGSVASATTAFSLTTTEQVIGFIQANLVTGQRVRVAVTCVANVATVGANVFLKVRQKVTASTTDITGTIIPGAKAAPNVSRGNTLDNQTIALGGEFVAGSSGLYTFVWTGNTSTSTGTVAADASNHGYLFTADAVGT